MTDNPSDVRLHATEMQMRRALGLDRETSPVSQLTHSPNPSNGPHQRRQFARDGDVPVTMVHSDSSSRLQQLDAARQTLRQQTVAREEAERLLADARNTIHDLETKLGHERLANDEVTQRISAESRQIEEALTAAQEELAAERVMRARAERERDEAAVARRTAEQRLRQRMAVKAALPPPAPFPSDQPPRRRGRPPKVARQDVAQTIRGSWNGGRRGGKRSIGSRVTDAAATAGASQADQPPVGYPPGARHRRPARKRSACLESRPAAAMDWRRTAATSSSESSS
jgi:hypothetical protein